METSIQRTNRIYANVLKNTGTIYKVKTNELGNETRRDKLANAPEHCLVDNANEISIKQIDKSFYINVALKRITDFKGESKMEETKPKRGRKPKAQEVDTVEEVIESVEATETDERIDEKIELDLKENEEMTQVLEVPCNQEEFNRIHFQQKLMNLQKWFDSYNFVRDGYNTLQKYDYIKAHQYKTALRQGCIETGLNFKVNVANVKMDDLVKSDKMHLITIHGSIVLTDVQTGYSDSYFIVAQGSDNLDKGLYKAMTMMIKSFVQMNFLISDGDEDYGAQPNTNLAPEKKFVSDQQRIETKVNIVTNNKLASKEYLSQIISMITEVQKFQTAYGLSTFNKIAEQLDGVITMSNTEAVKIFSKVEEKMAELGIGDL